MFFAQCYFSSVVQRRSQVNIMIIKTCATPNQMLSLYVMFKSSEKATFSLSAAIKELVVLFVAFMANI